MLSSHYRSPINFSAELIEASKTSLERIYNCKNRLAEKSDAGDARDNEGSNALLNKFRAAMDDDLNTADAIAVLFEAVREANTKMAEDAPKEVLSAYLGLILEISGVLAILQREEEKDDLSAEVEKLIAERQAARKEKNFALADEIRAKIENMGIILEDTREGVKWHKKS